MARVTRRAKSRRDELDGELAMQLLIGPPARLSRGHWRGQDPAELWRDHRDEVMAMSPLPGRRPWAWCQFEPGIPERLRSDYHEEARLKFLVEAGHIDAFERSLLAFQGRWK